MRLRALAKTFKKRESSDFESKELENGSEIDKDSGCNRTKYLIFKLPKNMADYKWELGTLCYQH